MISTEVLEDGGHLRAPGAGIDLRQIDPIHQHLPFGGIVEATEELDDGGLAGPIGAHNGQRLPGRDGEIESVERFHRLAGVLEGDPPEADSGGRAMGRQDRADWGVANGKTRFQG